MKKFPLLTRFLDRIIFVFLDWVFPKDNRIIVFGSAAGRAFNGNPRAVFDYVVASKPDYRPYVFLRDDVVEDEQYAPLEKYLISNKTLRHRFILLKARTLVGAHGQADFGVRSWSYRKIFIQTWHGRGTKDDGFAFSKYPKKSIRNLKKHNRLVTAFITASKVDSGEKARCFNINDRKLFPLGYPRNDFLLKKHIGPGVLTQGRLPHFNRVVLYSPTYRPYADSVFFPFEDFSVDELNAFLEKHEAIILLRPHINDRGRHSFDGPRIIDFGFDVCPDVNQVLPEVDILMTDYSSIFLDFLLMGKPIVFIPYDLKEYESHRGFLYGDYDFWTPGYKAHTFAGLMEEMAKQFSGRDGYREERAVFNRFFNSGQSDNSSGKVFRLIEELLQKY